MCCGCLSLDMGASSTLSFDGKWTLISTTTTTHLLLLNSSLSFTLFSFSFSSFPSSSRCFPSFFQIFLLLLLFSVLLSSQFSLPTPIHLSVNVSITLLFPLPLSLFFLVVLFLFFALAFTSPLTSSSSFCLVISIPTPVLSHLLPLLPFLVLILALFPPSLLSLTNQLFFRSSFLIIPSTFSLSLRPG